MHRVKIFADGADLERIRILASDPAIQGFTTNPTLMRGSGVDDYEIFGREILEVVDDLPVSFEVFADDPADMRRQALKLAAWGPNVYVKIPVTNTEGTSTAECVRALSHDGVRVNVTAVFTRRQVEVMTAALAGGSPSYVSVFAGRIADAGIDPVPVMQDYLDVIGSEPQIEMIWASPREILNVVQADRIGCHVITLTHDLLKKLPALGKDLDEFSLDTVRMFANDAAEAGYEL